MRLYSTRARRSGKSPRSHQRPLHSVAGNGAGYWPLLPAAIGLWRFAHPSAPIPIAVLPLENTGHDPADEYFADGLTDELIRNLSIIDGLAVRSRTSSFGLKDKASSI